MKPKTNGKKFMSKRFKKLLLENAGESMPNQKENLNEVYKEWRKNHEQTDDIIIIGIKL